MSDHLLHIEEAKARAERRRAMGEDLDMLVAEAEYWLAQATELATSWGSHGLAVVDPSAMEAGTRIKEAREVVQYARRRARELTQNKRIEARS